MIALKRILVPHDFSDTSKAAVSYAVALARSFGADLMFLYVGDRSRGELDAEIPIAADGRVDDAVKARLLDTLTPEERAAFNAQFHVRAGTPAAEIIHFASEHDVDLIVMGTHGRGFVGHMMMGSVAERVVRTAPCPVLTVRRPGQATEGIEVVPEALDAARASV
jgi:nucleotide-binding universal stress UspA family protein